VPGDAKALFRRGVARLKQGEEMMFAHGRDAGAGAGAGDVVVPIAPSTAVATGLLPRGQTAAVSSAVELLRMARRDLRRAARIAPRSRRARVEGCRALQSLRAAEARLRALKPSAN
jgi:hypothetical protein